VKPFALTSATQFDDHPEVAPGPNYLQSKKKLNADLAEVVEHSADLDPRRKLIVEYWADGPESELPPGHWSLFAQFVSARDKYGIDQDVKLFFAMQNASFDAGILAWHQKRKHVGVRPITAIRYFYDGRRIKAWGGPGQPVQLIDGGKWTPYNPGSNLTPAFPGYVSGHSTFSAASAVVLRAFTGSDRFGFETTIPANFGRVEPGVPAVPTVVRYSTFTAAVDEAGLSRLYGGIHFADDNTVGQVLGTLAGQQAWAKAQFLFDGGLAVAGSSSTTAADAKKLSWNHQVGSQDDRLLVVAIATTSRDSYAKDVSYDGCDLSFLGLATTSNEDNQVELWYLKSPPSGTAKVSVRMSNKNDVVAGAVNFVGVNQRTPFGIVRTRGSDTAAACVTLANEPAPLVLSVLAANADALSVSPGSGQTVLWNAVRRADTNWTAYDNIGTAMVGPGMPVGDVCQVLQRARRWSLMAVPLKPAR
jgi:membrane-associated phospholipid phosphatase